MRTLKFLNAFATCLVFSFIMLYTPVVGQNNPTLSDAEVASVAVIANQIDIDHAQLANEKSKNKEVLQFAETMIRDHKAVIKQASDLVQQLGVTPKENAVGKQLQADAEKTSKMLGSMSGSAFDKAYVDNEVAYHKAVISAVEGLLIPEAENAELKSLLQSIVPALNAHLEHAQMLQKQLAGK
jgi:putative membrane protein